MDEQPTQITPTNPADQPQPTAPTSTSQSIPVMDFRSSENTVPSPSPEPVGPVAPPSPEPEPSMSDHHTDISPTVTSPTLKHGRKTGRIILILLIAVILASLAAYYYLKNNKTTAPAVTTTQNSVHTLTNPNAKAVDATMTKIDSTIQKADTVGDASSNDLTDASLGL
jgi:hypothetical protein